MEEEIGKIKANAAKMVMVELVRSEPFAPVNEQVKNVPDASTASRQQGHENKDLPLLERNWLLGMPFSSTRG